jgi:hypothetical protein
MVASHFDEGKDYRYDADRAALVRKQPLPGSTDDSSDDGGGDDWAASEQYGTTRGCPFL